jgi:uncharacterized HAD superfamily protein
MKIGVDIDGVLCEDRIREERSIAKPLYGAKERINKWYYDGHEIILFTARTWSEYNMTKCWLDANGFKYHILICGKPMFDIFIDDRAVSSLNDPKLKEKLNEV